MPVNTIRRASRSMITLSCSLSSVFTSRVAFMALTFSWISFSPTTMMRPPAFSAVAAASTARATSGNVSFTASATSVSC